MMGGGGSVRQHLIQDYKTRPFRVVCMQALEGNISGLQGSRTECKGTGRDQKKTGRPPEFTIILTAPVVYYHIPHLAN